MARSVEVMDWDSEEQAEALSQARALSERDPEASALLIQTLIVTQDAQKASGVTQVAGPSLYNPIKLYEFAAKEWGYLPRDIDEMHYPAFFAMIDLANDRRKQENDAYNNAK